jgi:hypothetical protein
MNHSRGEEFHLCTPGIPPNGLWHLPSPGPYWRSIAVPLATTDERQEHILKKMNCATAREGSGDQRLELARWDYKRRGVPGLPPAVWA